MKKVLQINGKRGKNDEMRTKTDSKCFQVCERKHEKHSTKLRFVFHLILFSVSATLASPSFVENYKFIATRVQMCSDFSIFNISFFRFAFLNSCATFLATFCASLISLRATKTTACDCVATFNRFPARVFQDHGKSSASLPTDFELRRAKKGFQNEIEWEKRKKNDWSFALLSVAACFSFVASLCDADKEIHFALVWNANVSIWHHCQLLYVIHSL